MKSLHRAVCMVALTCAGCGPSEPTLAGPKAPHGGTIVRLPSELGNVEIVREEVAGKLDQTRLLLYFIDPEGQPIAATPTAATLKPKERGIPPVSFKPVEGGDPSKAGAWESKPFPAGGDISGELAATIDGKPMTVTINVR